MGLKFRQNISAYLRALCGATAIEYALIAGGVALALAVIVYTLGDEVFGVFEFLRDSFAGA